MSLLRLTLLICFVSAFVVVAQGFQCYTCARCNIPTNLANCTTNQCYTSRYTVGKRRLYLRSMESFVAWQGSFIQIKHC